MKKYLLLTILFLMLTSIGETMDKKYWFFDEDDDNIDYFMNYLMPTQRLFYGAQPGRAGQELASSRYPKAGMDNPNPLPMAAATSKGGLVIPGVDGGDVMHGFFPPGQIVPAYLAFNKNTLERGIILASRKDLSPVTWIKRSSYGRFGNWYSLPKVNTLSGGIVDNSTDTITENGTMACNECPNPLATQLHSIGGQLSSGFYNAEGVIDDIVSAVGLSGSYFVGICDAYETYYFTVNDNYHFGGNIFNTISTSTPENLFRGVKGKLTGLKCSIVCDIGSCVNLYNHCSNNGALVNTVTKQRDYVTKLAKADYSNDLLKTSLTSQGFGTFHPLVDYANYNGFSLDMQQGNIFYKTQPMVAMKYSEAATKVSDYDDTMHSVNDGGKDVALQSGHIDDIVYASMNKSKNKNMEYIVFVIEKDNWTGVQHNPFHYPPDSFKKEGFIYTVSPGEGKPIVSTLTAPDFIFTSQKGETIQCINSMIMVIG